VAKRLDLGEITVVDVRGAAEWEAGHIEGSVNIPLGHLNERSDEIPAGRPVVVHCLSGARSAVAASILQARGVAPVLDFSGGFGEWRSEGRPYVTEAVAGAAA
jgi:hydroxyacylglutathione hydrolase